MNYSGFDVSGTPKASTSDIARCEEAAGRKANGIYYTPLPLARVLCEWVLERRPQRILEPSYGNGAFLRAAYETLEQGGIPDPARRLVGVEIDPDAPRRVRDSGLDLKPAQLHQGDLLELNAKQLGGRFGAIAGNPPYIRHHLLPEELARRGRGGATERGVKLHGRSDAWAYFCAPLVRFLDDDGRLALVLPGSVLQAEYAAPLVEA